MSPGKKLAIALLIAIPVIMAIDIAMSGCITVFRPKRICGDDALQSVVIASVVLLVPAIIIFFKSKATAGAKK